MDGRWPRVAHRSPGIPPRRAEPPAWLGVSARSARWTYPPGQKLGNHGPQVVPDGRGGDAPQSLAGTPCYAALSLVGAPGTPSS